MSNEKENRQEAVAKAVDERNNGERRLTFSEIASKSPVPQSVDFIGRHSVPAKDKIVGYDVAHVEGQTRHIIDLAENRHARLLEAISAHTAAHKELIAKVTAEFKTELQRLQDALASTERVILAEKTALGVLIGAEAEPEPEPKPEYPVKATRKRRTRK